MRPRNLFMALLILGLATISPSAFAQYPKGHKVLPGSLDGSVTNPKGTPVSGAEIIWQAADGGIPHVLHSDKAGRFAIPRLRSGLYDLRATKGTIQSEWSHNILIREGKPTSVELRLETNAPASGANSKLVPASAK